MDMDVFTGVNRHYELKYFVIVKKVFLFKLVLNQFQLHNCEQHNT